jgi:hypothetical protein
MRCAWRVYAVAEGVDGRPGFAEMTTVTHNSCGRRADVANTPSTGQWPRLDSGGSLGLDHA